MTATELDKTPITKLKTDEDILRKMENNVQKWYSAYKENIDRFQSDVNFSFNDQWEGYERGEFLQRQKVVLTINVLYSYLMQIIAEQRQNSAQIEVRNLDGRAQQSEITMVENMLREIAYQSDSDLAYQTGFKCALMGGFGAWRVTIDYESHNSFDEAVKIVRIKDPLKCYFDPDAQHPTKCDGEYCGIYTRMTPEEFAAAYPEIDNPRSALPPISSSNDFNWFDGKEITVCEHFQKVYEKKKLCKLSNGDAVLEEDLKEHLAFLNEQREDQMTELRAKWMETQRQNNISGIVEPLNDETINSHIPKIKVVDERETTVTKIKQYKFIKDVILEEGEFYGHMLPIVFVDGDTEMLNGKECCRSFIRFARDAQKLLNFNVSEIAQKMKVSRGATFMATATQIGGEYKELWRNPEASIAALLYNPDPMAMANGGAPIVMPAQELPQTLLGMPGTILNLIQLILGRYEANKGEQGNEQSGRAIANRAKQGNLAVFVYLDNLNAAIEQTARICLHLLPYILTENRYIGLRARDGKTNFTQIKAVDLEKLKKMKYDVAVKAGSPFEMQKADSYAQLLSFIQLNPQALSTILADLAAENLNVSNVQQIVDRVKQFVVPSEIIAAETGQPPPPPKPNPQLEIAQKEAQARLMEAQAKLQKVSQDSNVAHMKTQAEVGKAMLDYQGKVEEYKHKAGQNNLQAQTTLAQTHAAMAKTHADIMKTAMGQYNPAQVTRHETQEGVE